MLTGKELKILTTLEPYAKEQGIELVTVEIVGAKKAPTIRIYIDCEDGVGFDELSQAQTWINKTMDELDPFSGAYTLEVSSPGIDRPLRTLEHFKRFIGEKALIQLSSPLNKRARWTGIIRGVIESPHEESVVLDVDGTEVVIPYRQIKKAHVIGTVDFSA